MLYQVSHGSKSFGADTIFEDIQFEIKGNEKVTIVGRNGCGKTTFLKCLCGEMSFDKGTVSMENNTTIGYLSQKQIEDDERTVEETLEKVFEPIFQIEEKMHELERMMQKDSSDRILSQYAQLQEEYESLNGYQWESEMMNVFTRFGFTKEDLKRPIKEFSGGQKTRIAFVRLLLSKPDILLLDEPTNHLDLETIEWLEGYVRNYPKAVVIVSHDRMFLDHTTDVVYEIEYGKMQRYVGNYTSFVEQKRNDIERRESAYRRQQKEIERLETLIEKFRYKKNKAAFAQSKIKYLDRMEKIDPVQHSDDRSFHAHFKPEIKGGERVLDVKDLVIGYDHPLSTINLEIHRQNRIAVIGPNGTGKSTFVKTIMGLVSPLSGSYLYGHQITKGYFDQQLAQFSSSKTVLEELWDDYPDLDRTTIRSVLGQFLFSADDVFKTVNVLSGGEKVRLSLAKLLLQHSNFLILDEPTNHLDIPGKEALEDALKEFTGTILFVSHDRYFISQIATGILELEDGKSSFYPLTYKEYEETKKGTVEQVREKEEVKVEKPKVRSKETVQREIKKIEEKITEVEECLEDRRALRFEEEYYQDYQKMNILNEEIDDIHNELAHLYEEWEQLNEEFSA
ncbi:MAG: ABC-F type ribosomal protection protein [Solobacterium sp.]|nr:ABC-F type ribosomal protection protein [Solobacterium sp.]